MRLIDIEDEPLLKTVSVGGLSAKALWRLIKSQRTIKAIPIEWIEKQIEWYRKKSEYLDKKYGDKQDFVNDAEIAVFYYEALIKDWEKENEID